VTPAARRAARRSYEADIGVSMRATCCADAHVTSLRVDAAAWRRQTRGLDANPSIARKPRFLRAISL
jgi:hypothetical protein